MAMPPNTDRRRPFSSWVRKLNQKMKRTKGPNNPYPQSGHVSSRLPAQRPLSQSEPNGLQPHTMHSEEAVDQSSICTSDVGSAEVEGRPPTTAPSYGGTSLAGTNITATDPRRADSTFSSPAPSARSVATTLSTIQSMAHHSHPRPLPEVQYSQPQALVAAMPPGETRARNAYRPATYSAIIANNLLTDNISILTLASSTQRRRRRSWDTDYDKASVRALPPSQFGGSRESLPLSVLSANLDGQPTSPGLQQARSIAERSVSGLTSGHGRADSLSGSIGGGMTAVASES